jgi:omega-amidase
MRLGLAQTNPLWEDKKGNFAAAVGFLEEARQSQVDFVLFPEMSMTGFSMHPEKIGEDRSHSETLQYFQKKAVEYGLTIGIGYVELLQPKSHNCYAIISPQGDILADYKKIHPFTFGTEQVHYEGGDRIAKCSVMDFMVTPFICYDLRFPEIFQVASKESQLIVVPANWPSDRREHFITLLKARAIENQCYIAGINRVGHARTSSYCGDSMVIDPYGKILAEGGDGEKLITADIDSSLVKAYREEFPAKKDRREDLYMLKWTR